MTVLQGRYRLERLIGRGGMAEVFAAHDESLDRAVAVKMLADRFSEDPSFVDRFAQEAQSAARLNHPNVVRVYDTGVHDGVPFIVMELVDGDSLAGRLRQGSLSVGAALDTATKVAGALEHAHQQGLIHRDVKPGNILLGHDGSVKVTDFGIARAVDAETVSQTAAVLGTAAYLSPEQAQGKQLDARSDIYSLGVVLFEMLTGQQPFTGDTPVTVAYQHVQEAPRSPREVDAAIPAAAESVTIRALAKNPNNRYATANAMKEDLVRAAKGQRVEAPAVLSADETALLDAPTIATEPIGQPKTRTATYVSLAMFTLAAMVGLGWVLASWFNGSSVPGIEVPDLSGQTVEEAETILAQRGLSILVGQEEFSIDVEQGRIIRQEPEPGTEAPNDSTVTVAVSLGVESLPVPDTMGLTREEAARVLAEAGFAFGTVTEVASEEVEEGLVISSNPRAGVRVGEGTAVDLTISAGTQTTRVPAVEGETEADARTALREADLQVLVVREFSDVVAEGIVISQDPDPGEEVQVGDTVTITVSNGPEASAEPSPSPSPSEPSDSETDEPSPSDDPSSGPSLPGIL